MENRTILNKVRELLGMEVKLEQRKLEDGVTIVEADSFEPGEEIMIVTEDEQMIPLPVGDYKMEDGQILVVSDEGIIAEIKEAEEEEEVIEEEVKEEAGYDDKEEEMAEAKPIKKTVESIVKETFFTEIENLKKENAELKAKIQELSSDKVTEEVTEEPTNEAEVSEPVAEKEEVELSSDEPADKPISYNPENVQKQEKYVFGKNRPRNIMDRVYEKLNK